MSKLYLHAGTHKTGTTALQNLAHTNREALLKQGLFYADYGEDSLPLKNAHNQFAHSLAKGDRDSFVRLSKIVAYWSSVAEAEGVPVLVSSEALWRHVLRGVSTYWEGRSAYMQRLAELLAPFKVEVILVYRRPDDFARSWYQERVNYGLEHLPEFPEWLRAGHQIFEYSKNAETICEAFPKVSHYIYEDLIQGDGLYENFFSIFDISIDGLESPSFIRKSLTPAETVIKNYANKFIAQQEEGRKFVRWMRRQSLAEIIDEKQGRPLDLWPSPEEREAYLTAREDDVSRLKHNFFPKRERELFPMVKGGVQYNSPRLTPEVAAQVEEYFSR